MSGIRKKPFIIKSNKYLYIVGKNETNSGKWDNHNTIARGWAGPAANYHPVTFRSIYNVDAQKPGSTIAM